MQEETGYPGGLRWEWIAQALSGPCAVCPQLTGTGKGILELPSLRPQWLSHRGSRALGFLGANASSPGAQTGKSGPHPGRTEL